MASKALELKSSQTTAEIEAGDGTVEIQMPLTLAGWNIVEVMTVMSAPAVVTSADGDHFIGEIAEVDEERYTVTVELS